MTKITLTNPINLGADNKLESFNLRSPMAGELRGIKLLDIMQMDASAHAQLIPRISEPMVSTTAFYQLQPSDLMTVMTEVINFFVTAQNSQVT